MVLGLVLPECVFPYALSLCTWCNFGLEANQYSTDGLSDEGINGYVGDSFNVLASDAL